MATTSNKIAYLASVQIACTFTSLATGSTRESAVVTNDTTSIDVLDALVSVCLTIASGTPGTASPSVNVYVSASEDGTLWPVLQKSDGTVYASGAGDAAAGALGTPTNLKLIGIISLMTTTSSGERTLRSEPYSVAQAFGGNLPRKWSVFVENQSGVAFSTSTVTTAQYVSYTGVYVTNG